MYYKIIFIVCSIIIDEKKKMNRKPKHNYEQHTRMQSLVIVIASRKTKRIK